MLLQTYISTQEMNSYSTPYILCPKHTCANTVGQVLFEQQARDRHCLRMKAEPIYTRLVDTAVFEILPVQVRFGTLALMSRDQNKLSEVLNKILGAGGSF